MGIFEDVIVNTKSAINVFGKKAGEFVDVSKLKVNAVETRNEISKKLEEIGKVVYESKKNNFDPTEHINSIVSSVDCLYEKLDAINEQIAYMKNKCKCKDCGCLNQEGSMYCCKCGEKINCNCTENKNSTTDNVEEQN